MELVLLNFMLPSKKPPTFCVEGMRIRPYMQPYILLLRNEIYNGFFGTKSSKEDHPIT